MLLGGGGTFRSVKQIWTELGHNTQEGRRKNRREAPRGFLERQIDVGPGEIFLEQEDVRQQ
jgi:hypothetical protein